jgi:hypothetical protein
MRKLIYILIYLSTQIALLGQHDTIPIRDLTKLEPITVEDTSSDTVYITSDSLTKLEPKMAEINLGGKVYSAIITENGDTLIVAADIKNVSITSPRSFKDDDEYRKYLKFRRYANKVYPYAKEAIRIFREVEYVSENLSKKEKKKRIKELQKELKKEFEEPLAKLTKLQGKILIKMIERELDETMYNLIKGLRGRFTAFYWHNFSKLYSYDLKEGYQYGKYYILDIVLQDYNISYDVQTSRTLKYIKIKEEN